MFLKLPIILSRNSFCFDLLGQHLLIPCFLSPGENLVGEGGRLLLLIINILLFVFKSKKQCKSLSNF